VRRRKVIELRRNVIESARVKPRRASELSPALQRREKWKNYASPGEPALSEVEGTEVLTHTLQRWEKRAD
jgi:hypothetical protein